MRWAPSCLPDLSSACDSIPAPKPKLWPRLGVVGDTGSGRGLPKTTLPVAATRGLQSGLCDMLQSDASGIDTTDIKTREARVTLSCRYIPYQPTYAPFGTVSHTASCTPLLRDRKWPDFGVDMPSILGEQGQRCECSERDRSNSSKMASIALQLRLLDYTFPSFPIPDRATPSENSTACIYRTPMLRLRKQHSGRMPVSHPQPDGPRAGDLHPACRSTRSLGLPT